MKNELYKCINPECDQIFKHASSRSRHHKTCKKGDVLKPKTMTECPNIWCKKSVTTKNFKRHLVTCKPKKISNHICTEPGCNKAFKKLSKLLRHQSSHNKQMHTCNHCFATYVRHDKFLIHMEKCEQSTSEITYSSSLLMSDQQPTMVNIHQCLNVEPTSPIQQVTFFYIVE